MGPGEVVRAWLCTCTETERTEKQADGALVCGDVGLARIGQRRLRYGESKGKVQARFQFSVVPG